MSNIKEIQSKLWHLAETEMSKIGQKYNYPATYMGGMAAITRNPDKSIRDLGKQEGSREWALLQSQSLVSSTNDELMNDTFCRYLIGIIEGEKK